MTPPAADAVHILASRIAPFACSRPDLVLKHGDHTPLSQAAQETARGLLEESGIAPADPSAVAVLGASRAGELFTLSRLARRFGERGIAGIDPVVFAKANQFFPVFATCKRLDVRGPASALFTSTSQAPDVLYFAYLLLRQGHASHVIALSYEYDQDSLPVVEDDEAPITGRVCAVLLGAPGEEGTQAPVLAACRLGPHLAATGRKPLVAAACDAAAAEGAGHHVFLCAEADRATVERSAVFAERRGSTEPAAPGEALLPRLIEAIDAFPRAHPRASDTVFRIIPPGRGNVVTAHCRYA